MLEWAWEHGCEWDELTSAHATEGGHLEMLQWARQHGCPWQDDLGESARRLAINQLAAPSSNCCRSAS